MKANRAYRLLFRRGGWLPAALADPSRIDHIEVVDVHSGEVVLFWDCSPQEAARQVKALRADLAQLQETEFMARWATVNS